MHEALWAHVPSFLLGTHLEVEFLAHIVTRFNLWRSSQIRYRVASPLTLPPAAYEGSSFSTPSPAQPTQTAMIWRDTMLLTSVKLMVLLIKCYFCRPLKPSPFHLKTSQGDQVISSLSPGPQACLLPLRGVERGAHMPPAVPHILPCSYYRNCHSHRLASPSRC